MPNTAPQMQWGHVSYLYVCPMGQPSRWKGCARIRVVNLCTALTLVWPYSRESSSALVEGIHASNAKQAEHTAPAQRDRYQ